MTYNQLMKEKELNENFGFTGVYCSNFREYRKGSGVYGSEAVKLEKKRPEYKGYKMRLVREEGGTSLYIELRYFKDKRKKELQNKIDSYENRKAMAYEKYLKELETLEEEQNKMIEELSQITGG